MLGSKSNKTSHTVLTVQLLEDTLHGTGASATGHSHIELVLVVRHGGNLFGGCGVLKERKDAWRRGRDDSGRGSFRKNTKG